MKAERNGRTGGPDPGKEGSDADRYSRGFEDGSRAALREVLSYVSRGHTASEIRLLAETKLAHLGEDSRERNMALLEMPRRVPLQNLMSQAGETPEAAAAPPLRQVMPGYSYLFLEDSPRTGRRFLQEILSKGLPSIVITRLPQDFEAARGEGKVFTIEVGSSETEVSETPKDGVRHVGRIPSDLTSPVLEYLGGDSPQAGCYVEALEYYLTESSFELTIKLIHWLNTQILRRKGVLAVSVNPAILSHSQLESLKADFNFH